MLVGYSCRTKAIGGEHVKDAVVVFPPLQAADPIYAALGHIADGAMESSVYRGDWAFYSDAMDVIDRPARDPTRQQGGYHHSLANPGVQNSFTARPVSSAVAASSTAVKRILRILAAPPSRP